MKQPLTFFTCVCELSASLTASGHYCRSGGYFAALQSVFHFCNDRSLSLKALFSCEFLRNYEIHLTHTGCVRNTISFYMNTLRSIYYQAVRRKLLLPVAGLFDDVFTGSDPTVKRAVDCCVVARMLAGDLSAKPRLEVCRDYFLLSLYLQGMSFVDLAHLRKCDVQGDLLTYRRRKTNGVVQVVILPEARALFDKYACRVEDSPYLLPLITASGVAGFRQYKSALHRQNRQLKEITGYLGISDNLTTYVARHCWATFAYHGGADVGVVSQGMGHHTETVTRTYLSSFGYAELERANRIVLSAILCPIASGEIKGVDARMQMDVVERVKEMAKYLNPDANENNAMQRAGSVMNVGNFGRVGNPIARRLEASRGDSAKVFK